VAIKKGQTRERAPDFKEMGTLRCDRCGEEFTVFHDPTCVDKTSAARQAHWLERFLPKSTNGNGNTRIESNCRISQPIPARAMSVNACLRQSSECS